jgi:hypothetical protein
MVKGHNIHKPKVRIPRLNLNDLQHLMMRPAQPQEEAEGENDGDGEAAQNGAEAEVEQDQHLLKD